MRKNQALNTSNPMTVVQKILMWGLFVTGGLSVLSALISVVLPLYLPGVNYLFFWSFFRFVVIAYGTKQFFGTALMFFIPALIALFFIFGAAVGVKKNQTVLPVIGLVLYVAEVLFILYRVIGEHTFFTTAGTIWAVDAFFITMFILYFRQKVLARKADNLQNVTQTSCES